MGQGAITFHSEEHFGRSDRGILMIRRMLSEQIEALAAGRDPAGVSFDRGGPGRVRSGEFHSRGVSVLIEPIKKEFALSDTMMGPFAVYWLPRVPCAVRIPIARVADRINNRRNIVMAQNVTMVTIAQIWRRRL